MMISQSSVSSNRSHEELHNYVHWSICKNIEESNSGAVHVSTHENVLLRLGKLLMFQISWWPMKKLLSQSTSESVAGHLEPSPFANSDSYKLSFILSLLCRFTRFLSFSISWFLIPWLSTCHYIPNLKINEKSNKNKKVEYHSSTNPKEAPVGTSLML